jgi:hypothetical protein
VPYSAWENNNRIELTLKLQDTIIKWIKMALDEVQYLALAKAYRLRKSQILDLIQSLNKPSGFVVVAALVVIV